MKKHLVPNSVIGTQGFTLVEILVAMGITAMILVALMQITAQGPQASKSSALDTDFSILASNVQTALTNDCTNFMQGQRFTLASPLPHYSMMPPNPGVSPPFTVQAGFPTVGMQVTSFAMSQTPTPIQTVGTGAQQNIVYQTAITLQAQKVGPSGQPALPGVQTFSKTFQVMLWVNASNLNQISQCQQQSAINNPVLTLSTPLPGAGCTVQASWTATPLPSRGVLQAWLVQIAPTPVASYPLSLTMGAPTTITPLPVPAPNSTYVYELMFTDLNGQLTLGTASPSPSPVLCP
jgi:prepilin-type N-terminal cleavage/methylation domain-containing protein